MNIDYLMSKTRIGEGSVRAVLVERIKKESVRQIPK